MRTCVVVARAFTSTGLAVLMLAATVASHRGRCAQVNARTVHTSVEEGALVSKADLLAPAPADEDHILPRGVIANEEGELSSRPKNTRILVVHYRAATKLGQSDDRIVLATRENGNFRVLRVLNSDATAVNGELSSLDDFDVRFISLRRFRFLYIRESQGKVVDDLVYTAVEGGPLIEIPHPDWKPTLLRNDEQLRNKNCNLGSDGFQCEAGIYLPKNSECCPSNRTYHSELTIKGGFRFDEEKRTFTPEFQFVLAKEWRTNEQ